MRNQVQHHAPKTSPTSSTSSTSSTKTKHVVRLSVNLASDVADALKDLSRDQDITVTEGVRRAIAVWKIVSEAKAREEKVMIVRGEGDDATYRELILL